jgi:hypothetical protein
MLPTERLLARNREQVANFTRTARRSVACGTKLAAEVGRFRHDWVIGTKDASYKKRLH